MLSEIVVVTDDFSSGWDNKLPFNKKPPGGCKYLSRMHIKGIQLIVTEKVCDHQESQHQTYLIVKMTSILNMYIL